MNKTDSNRQNDTRDLPTEPAGTVQEASEIPKFDLAERILAEQRKITAIRRKAPIKKNEPPAQEWEAEPIGYPARQKTGGVHSPPGPHRLVQLEGLWYHFVY